MSCEQNVGPFVRIDEPTISKDDLKQKLKDFYNLCLAPEYKKGYLTGINQNSESLSYALWQSYWADDRNTFKTILSWSNRNVEHDRDNLLSWKYEVQKRSPLIFWQHPWFGNYRVRILDQNAATDADTDFAYILLRAGADWKNQDYIDQGKKMAADIWTHETADVEGKRYVLAGNWANEPDRLVINPSYFSPQAYRTFALFDGSHDWNKLTIDTYDLLTKISDHGENQPRVPPNWIAISKIDGTIQDYPEKSDAGDYGYDSFRTLWRVSLDQWATPSFLSWNYVSSITAFSNDWQSRQEVCALYKHEDAGFVCDQSTTGTLAGPTGILSVTNGYAASQAVEKYYIRDGKLMFPDTDFYAKSWHWFGIWLWAHS
ncbi:MAG: hypothetical protein KW788_04760 [Candidatus Doudnabacteria bacterium]|nr:hypothetical protein [Candidatus Doudnabacteria bacterium]